MQYRASGALPTARSVGTDEGVEDGGMIAADDGTNWLAVVALAVAFVLVAVVLALFIRVVANRDGALDRTVERLERQPAWTRLGSDPRHVRRSQQFTAVAGVALLIAVLLLVGGLLMDQLTGTP
jgi:hypothetical protein